ncbi:MAG: TA system VapC family ribonuclease toxin [Bryobacteraceae bacterium]
MKRCLADVNVWFALLVRHHEHHGKAARWFEQCEEGEAVLCRQTQLGVMRLLGNQSILKEEAVTAARAWRLVEELLEDERVAMASEPDSMDEVIPTLLRYSVPTVKLVGDAYLAAFAMGHGMELATFDKGFRQYKGLAVRLM